MIVVNLTEEMALNRDEHRKRIHIANTKKRDKCLFVVIAAAADGYSSTSLSHLIFMTFTVKFPIPHVQLYNFSKT